MSTSCMQAIKQQLEAMPLDEFEHLLQGASVNKPHESLPQHAELLSQLKHHAKVQPDEPIQSKADIKECRTFWKEARHQSNQHQHRLSNSNAGSSNINGNIGGISPHIQNMGHSANQNKHPAEYTSVGKTFIAGDQNANPVSCTSDTASSSSQQPALNLNQGKYRDYTNHHHHLSTLAYGNSLDGDPGGSNRRSHERETNDNTVTKCTPNKNSFRRDEEELESDRKPENYTGKLPAQYILPNLTKFNNNSKDLPISLFPKPTSTAPLSTSRIGQSIGNGAGSLGGESSSSGPSSPWDLHTSQNTHVQLNDGYKSVSSVTSGCNYNDRITPARESTTATTPSSISTEQTFGTVRSVSPNLPAATSSALVSKSPTIEGSQIDKVSTRSGIGKKKKAKNVLREKVIESQEMPGYKGNQNIDELLEFVEGNQPKQKKIPKDKKKESKPKGNEKQVLSKAASLDENSLGYGSKSGEEAAGSRGKSIKDVEKKNSTNITKSSTAICSLVDSSPEKPTPNDVSNVLEPSSAKVKLASTPLVNGGPPIPNHKGATNKVASSTSGKSTVSVKNQECMEKVEDVKLPNTVKAEKLITPRSVGDPKETKAITDKVDDEKFVKPDEEGPYVLVQSKKKREKKKPQQRESENFARAHAEQARRDGGRVRRSNTERRKSVGSVPGSENSECSDDDDSVRSLPAGECTPRERIPKPCSSSGGTPQTSYADIARMSKDESGKTTTPPISILPSTVKTSPSTKPSSTAPVTDNSDFNFPALSPPTSSEKTVPAVVGAAVWPCRPRFDTDGVLKENKTTPNSKSEEVLPKESASPLVTPSPQSSSHPVSQKCSSKSLVDSKECCSLSKSSVDKIKDINSTLESEALVPPEVEVFQNNANSNPNTRASSCVEFGQAIPQPIVAKVPINRNDKKARDKSVKVSTEEALNKANLMKGTENNDAAINQPTEPVVFCGGKFDTSQLPVGKKSGFEFGFFEVIETLNENNNKTTSVSIEAPTTHLIKDPVDGTHNPKPTNRSQDHCGNKGTENEKMILKRDQVSQGAPEKLNKNKSDKLANRESCLHEEVKISPMARQVLADQPQTVTCTVAKPATATESVQSTKVPSSNTLEIKEKKAFAPLPFEDKKPKSKDIDIAQWFKPPPMCTRIPVTVLQAGDYMNAYANRLESLSKEGKLTYHKL